MQNINAIKKTGKIKAFGHSMWPILEDGDVIYLEKVKFSDIKVDDIVCFANKNSLVTHRVVYKRNDYIVAKGDNNPISDGKIRKNRILGVVHAFKRGDQKFDIEDLYLFQSSIYFDEIKRIVRLFHSSGIDYVFLKGLPLHLWLEERNPRRIFSDCDILVSKNQKLKVKKVLKNNGYKKIDVSLSKKHKSFRTDMAEESLVKYVGGYPIILDIHFSAAFLMTQLGALDNLYSKKLLDEFSGSLLNNKRVAMYEGEQFHLLSIEDQIIYLFLHLFHHNFKGGHRYDFLVRILNTKFDKELFVQTIEKYKLSNYVYSGLILLQKFYPNNEYKTLIARFDIPKSIAGYINKTVAFMKIYDEEERLEGGVRRFILLFKLSPEPYLKRVLIILNKEVLYSVYWVIITKIRQMIMFRLLLLQHYLKLRTKISSLLND